MFCDVGVEKQAQNRKDLADFCDIQKESWEGKQKNPLTMVSKYANLYMRGNL